MLFFFYFWKHRVQVLWECLSKKETKKGLERGCPWPKFMSTACWRGVPLPGSDATQWPPFYLFSVLLGHPPAFNDRKSLSFKACSLSREKGEGALSDSKDIASSAKKPGREKNGEVGLVHPHCGSGLQYIQCQLCPDYSDVKNVILGLFSNFCSPPALREQI